MHLNWLLIFEHARRRPNGKREHPLADPLERPEWQGLGWAVVLMARLSRRRRRLRRPAVSTRTDAVDRCYAAA